ncbi:MAG: hypothetical protein MZU91_02975 [Desulfosudis oleivorans]|nr:hypothetical protein [Desulfosudis oleivorans]
MESKKLGGIETVAEIMNQLDHNTENNIFASLKRSMPTWPKTSARRCSSSRTSSTSTTAASRPSSRRSRTRTCRWR